MKKLTVKIIALLLCFLPVSAFAEPDKLLNAWENCCELEIEVASARRLRHDALNEFLEKHAGKAYVTSNQKYIESIAGKSNIKTLVGKILEAHISDKKTRNRIINSMTLPNISAYRINQLHATLQSMIEPLRGPLPDGYKFAHFSRQPGDSVEKVKLVAKHEIGTWQTFERNYDRRIHKVRFFSPTKSDMFSGNRDVYLNRLEIIYSINGTTRNVIHDYKRMLKRGESIEFSLPEISQNATIKLSYATKPEHRNKAQFFVEPVAASLVDNPDSPFLGLIKNISRKGYKTDGLDNAAAALKNLKVDLRHALLAMFRQQQSTANPFITSDASPSKTGESDKQQYFLYMIRDENISREQLADKFSEMFGL